MPADPSILGEGTHTVHVIGVGGAGMSAIASVLKALGHRVSGSDRVGSPTTARLEAEGITVTIGHRSENLGAADVVTASPAVGPDNVELVEARRRGLTVMARSEVLAAISSTRRCAAVAGTHGKTTTSSMLTLALARAGLHPSFLIGADVGDLGTNGALDSGEWMVVEADESYGTFTALRPDLTALTSIEPDHLDHYGSLAALTEAFAQLLAATDGPCLVSADDPGARDLGASVGALGVGEAAGADYRVRDLVLSPDSVRFELDGPGGPLGPVELLVPGRHNAANAALAAAAALEIGAGMDDVGEALRRFTGSPRRFERRGRAGGVEFIDDYGHLPGEIAPTLAAARLGHPRRVVAVFQPHRYTRTAALSAQFAHAFDEADVVVVTDIYAAGEPSIPGVSGRLVADAVAGVRASGVVHYAPGHPELRALVASLLRPGDVCVTLGAGDLTALPDELVEDLAR